MSYLTFFRITIAVMLSAALALTWLGVETIVVVALAIVVAIGLLVALLRSPSWREEATLIRRDPERLRRETRKDLLYFGGFIVVAVVLTTVMIGLGLIHQG